MDSQATHKVAGGRAAIAATGERPECLPPYAPDCNPLEPMWGKVRQRLKSREPRNARQLHRAAGAAFTAVTPADCHGFF